MLLEVGWIADILEDGEDVGVKVIDYKTEKVTLDEMYGLSLQLVVYMYDLRAASYGA